MEKGILKPDAGALKNTDDLYTLIGRPLDIIPTIHVAGTNGKVNAMHVF
jgi:folylpolyglutamate synthase/dihydropteroate synthase